jgi:crotonobetainyl-CoA:carnitine CoA-transferase CaiB-like acyl-CoA transferase
MRILSLALNLPGPAALMRCRALGARCTKLEAPARAGTSSDPMASYSPQAYMAMHQGIRTVTADLKTDAGQAVLHRELQRADLLITSFRPSALKKLGLQWRSLHARYPRLAMVQIVGASGVHAEAPGHDLTYMAESGLVPGLDLPASLYADMGGALLASEAVLQARLLQLQAGQGVRLEVALSDAARYLALPRDWGLTQPGGTVGGAHAGYRVYPCKDGRVALAALEPHFVAALCQQIGVPTADAAAMRTDALHAAVARWISAHTRQQLETISARHDIPLCTMGL